MYCANEKPRRRSPAVVELMARPPGFAAAPVRRMKAVLTSCGAGVGDDARDRAMRQNAALMQHHEIVAGHDLVEQMRGPEHADAVLGDELADVARGCRRGP